MATRFLDLVENILKQDLDISDDAIRHEEGCLVVHPAMEDDRVLYVKIRLGMQYPPFVVNPWIFDIPIEDIFEVVGPRLSQNEKASK